MPDSDPRDRGIKANNIDPREDVRQIVVSLPFLVPAALLVAVVAYIVWDRRAEAYASGVVKELAELDGTRGDPARDHPREIQSTPGRLPRAIEDIDGTVARLGDAESNLSIMRLADPDAGDLSKTQVSQEEDARKAATLALGLLAADDPGMIDGAIDSVIARFELKPDDRLRTGIVSRYRAAGLPTDRLRLLLEKGIVRPLPPPR